MLLVTNIQFDAVDIGVKVEHTDPYGAFFSNLNLANAGWGAHALGIACGAGCDGNVVVRGASFWGAFHQAVSWNGTAFFSISDSTVETWSSQQGAMDLQGGRVGVRGCVSLSLGFISLLVFWTNLVRVLSQARSGFSRRRRPGPSACGWAQGCHAPFASATTCSDRAWSTTCRRRAPSLQTICNRTAPYMFIESSACGELAQ